MAEDEIHAIREELKAMERNRVITMRWAIGIVAGIGFSVLAAGWGWTDRISRDVTTLQTDNANTKAAVGALGSHEPRITVLEATYDNLARQIADGFAAIRSDIRDLRDADRRE